MWMQGQTQTREADSFLVKDDDIPESLMMLLKPLSTSERALELCSTEAIELLLVCDARLCALQSAEVCLSA
jgi:hypothetical protein